MRIRNLLLGAVVALAGTAAFFRADLAEFATRTGIAGLVTGTSVAAAPPPAPQAMPVPVAQVLKKTIPIYLDYAARTESIRAITLQAKVSAFVQEQSAPDGANVNKGDLLYRLDARDFKVVLDQANAQIERDAASLDYQKSSFHRGDELAKSGWLAKDSFDQRSSSMRQAEAALAADQATARAAQLNLDYAEIRAPFSGRLGRNQASVGTLVNSGGTALNTLVQLDPIYVTFNPSETDLAETEKARRNGPVAVEVRVPGEATPTHKGDLTFIDNAVDRSTGTVTARATIANKDLNLLPGQYVRVRVHVRDQLDALLVPQAAIGSGQLGKYVFVVSPDSKVEQRLVVLGPTDGELVTVLHGISESDRVITGNLQKIGPGMPVQALAGPGASPPS